MEKITKNGDLIDPTSLALKRIEFQYRNSGFIVSDVDNHEITFSIQKGPIKENGTNGCQIDEIGKVWLMFLQTFNEYFGCRENSITITKIEEALMWQQKRTEDRIKRNVEGENKL